MKIAAKIFTVVYIIIIALGISAEAQQTRVSRIGYLSGIGSAPPAAFVQALRELGYAEGHNIALEYRSADGNRARVPELAAELVRLKVDIIVVDGSGPSMDAKKASSTIPIVMTTSTDPVGTGLVASLARPGANVTGLTSLTAELGGKNLELLKEIVPRLSHVAILSSGATANAIFQRETEPTARRLGIKLLHVVVRKTDDIDSRFRVLIKERANGLLSRLGPTFTPVEHKRVAERAVKSGLPAISTDSGWADRGGLIYYGPDQNARYARVATYVDKILKGAKPAELPVEAPTKFELVINLRTAKQLGVTITQSVLYRADRVIN